MVQYLRITINTTAPSPVSAIRVPKPGDLVGAATGTDGVVVATGAVPVMAGGDVVADPSGFLKMIETVP